MSMKSDNRKNRTISAGPRKWSVLRNPLVKMLRLRCSSTASTQVTTAAAENVIHHHFLKRDHYPGSQFMNVEGVAYAVVVDASARGPRDARESSASKCPCGRLTTPKNSERLVPSPW